MGQVRDPSGTDPSWKVTNLNDSDVEAQFRAATEPALAALEDIVTRSREVRERASYLPEADSDAMLELDQEARFAGAWGAQPVTDCHAASWLVLVAGEDLIGSFIALARSPGAHVYGPMVLARAALEACARAKWLAAPGIGVRRRVARGETERLYSAVEINKIRRAMDTDVDDEVRTQILAEAERQGFTKKSRSGQSVVSLEEYRPTATECFRQLFGISDGFGETMFRYWSAVSHGTAYGLLGSLESLGHPMVSTGGLVPMGMKTSSGDIVFLVRALVLGYRAAVLAQRDLFGWTSEAWERTMQNTILLVSSRRGRP